MQAFNVNSPKPMPPKIIDTNVALTAVGDNIQASKDCQLACIAVVGSVLAGEYTVVIDDGHEVLGEYRRRIYPDLKGSLAEQFMVYMLTRQVVADSVHRIKLDKNANGQFLDYPDNSGQWKTNIRRCECFDPDDKKWVALAARFKNDTGADAPIVNAADRCWLAFEPHLESASVKLETLCRDER